MKFYLTDKFYKDTHNSNWYDKWEKELTDIWKPTYRDNAHSGFEYNGWNSVHFYFNDDKTFYMELGAKAKPNSKGKRSIRLEEFNEPIEKSVLVLIKLVQHGYARLEEDEDNE